VDYPRILGGVLDAVVSGIRSSPSLRQIESSRGVDDRRPCIADSRGLEWMPGPRQSRGIATRNDAFNQRSDGWYTGNALLQVAPAWRCDRHPIASCVTRPRKLWTKRPPPWPTRRFLLHRNSSWSSSLPGTHS
jgi:hypothetical protein